MKTALYSACLFLLSACGQNDLYRATVKSADSLNVVVNTSVNELQTPDSVELSRYQKVYTYYSQFVFQNINDTLSKSQADALQSFLAAGKEIDYFQSNRSKLAQRATLINGQLKALSADLEKKALTAQQGADHFANEKKYAQDLISHARSAKKNLLVAVQDLKNSVREVETIIRSRNHGDLPTIVKDSLTFQ